MCLLLAATAGAERLPEEFGQFKLTRALVRDSKIEKAKIHLEFLISEHPGTQIAAYAKYSLAAIESSLGNPDGTRTLLQEVLSEFTGTRFGYLARADLFTENYYNGSVDLDDWLAMTTELLVEINSPPVNDIINGVAQFRAGPATMGQREYIALIHELLTDVAGKLASAERRREAINVYTYILMNLTKGRKEPLFEMAIVSEAQQLIEPGARYLTRKGTDTTPPVLSLSSPLASVVGSPVTIRIKAHDGPLTDSRIKLSSANLLVDNSEITELQASGAVTNGRLEFTFRFTGEFSSGPHTGVFQLSDGDNNASELTFAFTVGDVRQSNETTKRTRSGGQIVDASFPTNLFVSLSKHYLRAPNSERSSAKEMIRDNAIAAYAGQVALASFAGKNPLARTVVQTAYRSWLNSPGSHRRVNNQSS